MCAVSQDSQFGGYTDTVVGSEGCAFGFQPFTVNFSFDGIGEEVMLNIVKRKATSSVFRSIRIACCSTTKIIRNLCNPPIAKRK